MNSLAIITYNNCLNFKKELKSSNINALACIQHE